MPSYPAVHADFAPWFFLFYQLRPLLPLLQARILPVAEAAVLPVDPALVPISPRGPGCRQLFEVGVIGFSALAVLMVATVPLPARNARPPSPSSYSLNQPTLACDS